MMKLRVLFSMPLFHLTLLTGAILASFLSTTITPLDDHGHYQRFIEGLAAGSIDFSIAGFHGASFLALPIHLLMPSYFTNIYMQLICALLIVPVGYFAIKALLRDRGLALLFAYALALSPFFFYVSFRGFTFSSYTLFLLLSIWLYARGSRFAWIALGISFLIKPFSIALAPLFLFWCPLTQASNGQKKDYLSCGWVQLLLALLFPLIYIIAEYAQIGRIIVGAHASLDQSNVFVWWKIPLNLMHGVQMLFSVHNYYFPDPSKTGPGNLVHTSSLLMIFGTFSLMYRREFWKDVRLGGALALCAIIAFVIPSLLDHMDHFYLETAVILLMIAALPVLKKYPLLIPLTFLTFAFQWLYAYLQFREVFVLQPLFFAVPVVSIATFLLWCILNRKDVFAMLQPLFSSEG